MAVIQEPKSQYEQIADLLRQRILDGVYPPATSLPSEPELAAELDVSRVTVNQAIKLLRAAGLVRVVRGTGTFVRSLPVIVRDARARYARRGRGTGAGEVEITGLSLTSRTDYTEIAQLPAPADVSKALKINEGDRVLVRRRVLYANDEPTQIADSYYPARIVAGSALERADTGPGGSLNRLAELGYVVERFTEDVTVRLASDAERKVLWLDRNQPVFNIVHIAWTDPGQPIEVAFHVMPGHVWSLRYEWNDPADDGELR